MCIICNDADELAGPSSAVLHSFDESRQAMKRAAESMLHMSKTANNADARKRYDRAHKKMARLMREWNAIEEEREASIPDELIIPYGDFEIVVPTKGGALGAVKARRRPHSPSATTNATHQP